MSKDLDGIIKTWNPGAERLFGYTAERSYRQTLSPLLPEFQSIATTRNPIYFPRASSAVSASITMKPFAGEKMEV